MEELNGPTRIVRENQLFLFPRAAAFNHSHFSPFFSGMLAPQYPDPAECAVRGWGSALLHSAPHLCTLPTSLLPSFQHNRSQLDESSPFRVHRAKGEQKLSPAGVHVAWVMSLPGSPLPWLRIQFSPVCWVSNYLSFYFSRIYNVRVLFLILCSMSPQVVRHKKNPSF